tara:strand:+ start:230 stop:436 length:207 start_codon:yes stop_codon:yes gene_type:complete
MALHAIKRFTQMRNEAHKEDSIEQHSQSSSNPPAQNQKSIMKMAISQWHCKISKICLLSAHSSHGKVS